MRPAVRTSLAIEATAALFVRGVVIGFVLALIYFTYVSPETFEREGGPEDSVGVGIWIFMLACGIAAAVWLGRPFRRLLSRR